MFICSVVLYSEVKQVVLENWGRHTSKKTETEKGPEKIPIQIGMNHKKFANKAEFKTHKKTTLLCNDGRKERQKDYLKSAVCFSFPPSV